VLETQVDYEAVVHLAVFRSAESAQTAHEALSSAGIEHTQRPLPPGRYQVADPGLRTYTSVIIGAAIIGGLVGVVVGILFALRLTGAESQAEVWFALAGAGGGAIIGGLFGLAKRAQYDDDVARTIEVPAEPSAVLISTYTSPTSPSPTRVLQILEQNGSIAFLDVSVYSAGVRAAKGVPLEQPPKKN
jgi:hypothetical protein